jgi:hypothetical protein
MDLPCRSSEPPHPLAPEQLPEAPRPVEFTTVARFHRGVALAAFLLVPNLILYYGDAAVVQPYRDLEAQGRATDGVVTHRRITTGKGAHYYVRYRYTVNGMVYLPAETTVEQTAYAAMQDGSIVRVTYLPSDPGKHCLGEPADHVQRLTRLVFLWAVGVALALGVWFLYQYIAMSREMHLARNATAVVGRISQKDQTRNKSSITYWVRYEFSHGRESSLSGSADLGGEAWVKVGWHSSHHFVILGTSALPKDVWDYLSPGLRVTVLFLPENPRRFQLLCGFRHVRFLPVQLEEGEEESTAAGQEQDNRAS